MNEEEIKNKIMMLKSKLSGILLEDIELQQEIYELKKQLNPDIENNPESDEDGCLYCGS